MKTIIKIKKHNSQFDILDNISNPYYKKIISQLMDIINFNDFKKNLIEYCENYHYINLSNFQQKINSIKIKKNQGKNLQKFLDIKLFAQNFDVITTITWLNLTSTKIINLNEIETILNIKLSKSQIDELHYLSFENIDPFNIKNYLLPYEKDLILKMDSNDFIVTPYLLYLIEQSVKEINQNIYITDETFYKIFTHNSDFYRIANYFVLTKKQIQYAYKNVLDFHLDDGNNFLSDFVNFLDYKQRYKEIDNYKFILKLKKLKITSDISNLLIFPEKFLWTYYFDTDYKKIKQNINLIKNIFTHKKQRDKIIIESGWILDDYSNEELARIILTTKNTKIVLPVIIDNLNDKEVKSFIKYVIDNKLFQIIDLIQSFLHWFNNQEFLLSIFKENQFNPRFKINERK